MTLLPRTIAGQHISHEIPKTVVETKVRSMYRIIPVVALMVAVFLFTVPTVFAQDTDLSSCQFYGTVEVDGKSVEDGTIITAVLDGVRYTTQTQTDPSGNSGYSLQIRIPGETESPPTTPIFFVIGDIDAHQTATFIPGGTVFLELTAEAGASASSAKVYGTVTIDGKSVRDGTKITVVIGEDKYYTTTTKDAEGNSIYSLVITPDSVQDYSEPLFTFFMIGDSEADESTFIKSGDETMLDLSRASVEDEEDSMVPTIALILLCLAAIIAISPSRTRLSKFPTGKYSLWAIVVALLIAALFLLTDLSWSFGSYPEDFYIPLGDWTNTVVDWIKDTFEPVFDFITTVIRKPLVWIRDALHWFPWPVVIGIFSLLALRLSGKGVAAFTAIALMFIGSLGHGTQFDDGYWDLTMITMSIMIVSVFLSLFIGMPLGILSAKSNRFETLLRPILDTMQTMPSFVYLVPAVILFGIGMVPAVIATVIYAIPPCIRLTNLGIRQVPDEAVEAGKAFGTTPWQLLFKIQLPLAMPNIMAGVNQTVMMGLAMVVIGSMIGAGGIGYEVLVGLQRQDVGRAFTGGLSIVLLAMVLDRITQGIGKVGPDKKPSRWKNRWLQIILG